jgi:hypothetical protein
MTHPNRVASVCAGALLAVSALAVALPARADPAKCQSAIAKQLQKYKKTYLKAHVKCLKNENRGVIPGPCPDLEAQQKIQDRTAKVNTVIPKFCTPADLAALNYRTDCVYESNTAGAEATCAAKVVLVGPDIDPTLLAECLECWKAAELSEYIALLYASHAVGVCGGTTAATSSVCSDLDCTSPLPDQRDLSAGDGDCQHGIGKAGVKYMLKREKILENCALAGGTAASCLADLDVQFKLGLIEQKKMTKIHRKCGNRDPSPSPPFCCRTGTGNSCSVAADRDDCVMNLSGTVQEDKTCDMGSCAPVMGNKKITWWGFCPESDTCPGTALSTLDDLIDCVDTSANAIVDELMCIQFRGNGGLDWPCPPSE